MPNPKQAAGRPRDQKVDQAIVRATRELLAETGYARLTVDAVAARAGVGKAAIYRRYTTKQQMIYSATVHDLHEDAPPDNGSLRADLAAVCAAIAAQLGSAPSDVLNGLLADIYADPSLAARFTATFVARQHTIVSEVLDRATARGELATPPDPALVHALLIGPIFAWLLILTGDPDRLPELVRAVADSTASALLSG